MFNLFTIYICSLWCTVKLLQKEVFKHHAYSSGSATDYIGIYAMWTAVGDSQIDSVFNAFNLKRKHRRERCGPRPEGAHCLRPQAQAQQSPRLSGKNKGKQKKKKMLKSLKLKEKKKTFPLGFIQSSLFLNQKYPYILISFSRSYIVHQWLERLLSKTLITYGTDLRPYAWN